MNDELLQSDVAEYAYKRDKQTAIQILNYYLDRYWKYAMQFHGIAVPCDWDLETE